jgi:enamine deaminase RidA (YjgF/YER057c/UK114 family)
MPEVAMKRTNIASAARWEDEVGYSRAVRVGPHIHVSGTTAFDSSGRIVGAGDPYAQARQALHNIAAALEHAGSSLEHVVRTRIYVTDIASQSEEVGRAHRETFAAVRPAATMVQVASLIAPEVLVEIEADAVVTGSRPAAADSGA